MWMNIETLLQTSNDSITVIAPTASDKYEQKRSAALLPETIKKNVIRNQKG